MAVSASLRVKGVMIEHQTRCRPLGFMNTAVTLVFSSLSLIPSILGWSPKTLVPCPAVLVTRCEEVVLGDIGRTVENDASPSPTVFLVSLP